MEHHVSAVHFCFQIFLYESGNLETFVPRKHPIYPPIYVLGVSKFLEMLLESVPIDPVRFLINWGILEKCSFSFILFIAGTLGHLEAQILVEGS